jgi:EpsI family protein
MKLNSRLVIISVLLLLTVGMRTWANVAPTIPDRKTFKEFPDALGEWKLASTSTLTESIEKILLADDYLLKTYRDPSGKQADLFVAYYRSQRAGESMHSPKNCLPGSGWMPTVNDTVVLQKDSQGKEIRINRYVVENGTDRALALYWYQENGRVIASEYWGKFYLVWDALRTGRRDGAIVRVMIPLRRNENIDGPTEVGLAFARTASAGLPAYLPK